jgi:hypothetical protein
MFEVDLHYLTDISMVYKAYLLFYNEKLNESPKNQIGESVQIDGIDALKSQFPGLWLIDDTSPH